MSAAIPYRFQQLKFRYRTIQSSEVISIAIAAGLLVWAALGWVSVGELTRWSLTLATTLAVGFMLGYFRKLFVPDPNFLIRYLNSCYPELEESVDLLTRSDIELTVLQRIQQARIRSRLDELYPKIKLPHNKASSAIAIVFVFVAFLLMAFAPGADQKMNPQLNREIKQLNQGAAEVKLERLTVTITPPAYTLLPSRTSESLELKVPEGSQVVWTAYFNKPVVGWLILSGRDSLAFTRSEHAFEISTKIQETGFYQLAWRDHSNWVRSDYYKIEVQQDQPPRIDVRELEQFTRLGYDNNLRIELNSVIHDDYGLLQAGVIATVSKGSGESVKFREEKLAFRSPELIQGKQVAASLTLDLHKLGMEPGDELYFYVEARDNKTPESNYSRTETFFIAIQDTTQYSAVDDEGLGVDLMPEYFRSQRQIIMDTEKLLREKKRISAQQFKFTSNELGYDQKVLRLRYGQFMGEEFEDQIGGVGVAPEEQEDETAEETARRLSHQHDTENEHNLVEQKKPTDEHNHSSAEHEDEDPLAAFAHQHDDGEQATFFIESVRTKLKNALAVMWDAELYLRLYEPEKSLPYQYTALRLLKEISNDSRIYVHRTGFDPPPLKEEKRLSGDLTEVKSATGISKSQVVKKYLAIAQAQELIEQLWQNDRPLSVGDRAILTKAGNELAVLAGEEPGKYLQGLSMLKQLTDETMLAKERRASLLTLRKIFWQIAATEPAIPTRHSQSLHALDQEFLKRIHE